jgi:hypothetical protein
VKNEITSKAFLSHTSTLENRQEITHALRYSDFLKIEIFVLCTVGTYGRSNFRY